MEQTTVGTESVSAGKGVQGEGAWSAKPGGESSKRRPSHVPAVLLLSLGLLLASAQTGESVFCSDQLHEDEHELTGFFVQADVETSLFLRGGGGSCFLQHEAGPRIGAEELLVDYASFEGICRDPESGLDHAMVCRAAGNAFSELSFWSVDPVLKLPVMEYGENWHNFGVEEVAADGSCLWRARKKTYELFQQAMSVLYAGDGLRNEDGVLEALSPRHLSPEIVVKWLLALEAADPSVVHFEAPRYASRQDWDSWTVILLRESRMTRDSGVVLVLDRKEGTWQAIYNFEDHAMNNMFVSRDTLFADLRSYWHGARYYKFDLRSSRATAVGRDAWDSEEETRIIHK